MGRPNERSLKGQLTSVQASTAESALGPKSSCNALPSYGTEACSVSFNSNGESSCRLPSLSMVGRGVMGMVSTP